MDKPIHIRIKTDLGNTFEKTFYPPTANMIIDLKGDTDIPYLDGSNSDNTGDAYIVSWEWNITSYPYLFQDLNNDSYFNNSEKFLRYFDYNGSHFLSKTRVQGEHYRGGKIAFEDNNTAKEPFIFWDKNNNNTFDNDEEILNYDPDGNGINAIVSGNETGYIWTYNSTGKPFLFYDNRSDWVYNEAEGDFRIDYTNFNGEYGKNDKNDTDGGVLLFIKWNKEFYGRLLSNLLNEGCLHKITLTVTNNYGLKGKHTMYYKY
ncbi:MAG: hypothetical protein QCI00_08175, partial [Candidatus Thermoplasmatota archaeon]|nr:hypothetical protein [Candidatus Thermoplasmatota archaeon]